MFTQVLSYTGVRVWFWLDSYKIFVGKDSKRLADPRNIRLAISEPTAQFSAGEQKVLNS